MYNYNRVVLVGRLTRDPEVRKIGSGKSVVTLGLAMTEAYRNAAGEKVEKPCFVDAEVWGDMAEACGTYLKKGRPVLVDGKLQLDEWESKTGERRQKLKVRAQNVQFLGDAGQPERSMPSGGGRKLAGKSMGTSPRDPDGDGDGGAHSPF